MQISLGGLLDYVYFFFFQALKSYSSNLSKIVVMSLVISNVYFSNFERLFLRVKKRVMWKLVIVKDQSSRYRSSSFSLN